MPITIPENFFLRQLALHGGELDSNSRPTPGPRAY